MRVFGLIFVVLQKCTATEFFSSIAHLENLLQDEIETILEIRGYLEAHEEKIRIIRQKVDEIDSARGNESLLEHLSHPVNQFQLIKRFADDWVDVAELLQEPLPTPPDLSDFNLPSEEILGASQALSRLSDVYEISPLEMAVGNISDSAPKLSPKETFEIGKALYVEKEYYHCAKWMDATRGLLANTGFAVNTPWYSDILDYESFCYSEAGNIPRALQLTREILTYGVHGDLQRINANADYFAKQIKKRKINPDLPEKFVQRPTHFNPVERKNYEKLCQIGLKNREIHHDGTEENLICFYYHGPKDNFWLLLGPVRTEEIAKFPMVVRFHDVIYEKERKALIEMGTERLNRATVFDPTTHKLVNADYRVSKSAWLKDEDSQIVETYNRRISAITGLNLKYAEELQMSNYGIGGQYEPHYDYSRREKDLYNNRRIATWLSYLSTVELGGGTVFTTAGIHVRSISGSAVFWYNLLPNGSGDTRTRHAACPVLKGNKWVSNKWVHEFGNEFRRSCGLEEHLDNYLDLP